MTSLGDELRLLIFVAVQLFILYSCWRFVSRFIDGRLQRLIDTLLLAYVIQYAAVTLPGAAGWLSPVVMLATAGIIAGGLFLTPSPGIPGEGGGEGRQRDRATRSGPHPNPLPEYRERGPDALFILTGLLFVAGYIAAYSYTQRLLPPMGTDALTYHFPAAVQWLQHGRIDRLQMWFFNPANTYSPLAGSVFYAWLLGPIGNDAMAIHAQAPMVLLLFLAAVAIGRSLGATTLTAVLAAVAICLSRPIVNQIDKGKDDLFLAAFFAVAAAGLSPKRLRDPLGPWRVGVAIGLCLATKYTALLAMPMLLLAIDAPVRAGWRWRRWLIAAACAFAVAGPWYLATWVETGNPLYPTDFLFFKGLFTTARSHELRTVAGVLGVLMSGGYGIPEAFGATVLAGWAGACVVTIRRLLPLPRAERAGVRGEPSTGETRSPVAPGGGARPRDERNQSPKLSPLTPTLSPPGRGGRRLVLIGPVVGFTIFVTLSPYPEVRFLVPALFLLVASINLLPKWWGVAVAGAAAAAAVTTSVSAEARGLLWQFIATGVFAAVVGAGFYVAHQRVKAIRDHLLILAGVIAVVVAGYAWVNWRAFIAARSVLAVRFWADRGNPAGLWAFVRDEIPPGQTIAYTGTHMIYPLMGFDLDRRVIHVPVGRNVRTIADLLRLGERLAGEQIAPAMHRAMVRDPTVDWIFEKLNASGAKYIVVMRSDLELPEREWIPKTSERFDRVYSDEWGAVYRIK